MKATKCVYFLLILVPVLLLSACTGRATPDFPPLTGLTPPAITVYITDDTCPTVEVESGFTVGWRNAGKKMHILKSELLEDGRRLFDAGTLQPGDAFAMTFAEPAVIPYLCSEDGSLQGTITVTGTKVPPTPVVQLQCGPQPVHTTSHRSTVL